MTPQEPPSDPGIALEVARHALARAKIGEREKILQDAWSRYCDGDAQLEVEGILLAQLSPRLSLMALDLRESSPAAREMAPQDLIRAGLLGIQIALDSLRGLDWEEVEGKAEELARQAMLIRSQRPQLYSKEQP